MRNVHEIYVNSSPMTFVNAVSPTDAIGISHWLGAPSSLSCFVLPLLYLAFVRLFWSFISEQAPARQWAGLVFSLCGADWVQGTVERHHFLFLSTAQGRAVWPCWLGSAL